MKEVKSGRRETGVRLTARAWGPENRQVQKFQRRGNRQELQLEGYGSGECLAGFFRGNPVF